MIRSFVAALAVVMLSASGAAAQQSGDADGAPMVWVQIEAQPNLAAINEALRRRSANLQDVNGFDLDGSGWYVVALGPYEAENAEDVLRRLRRDGRIPRDSYIAQSSDYARQIWPVGANLLNESAAAVRQDPATPELGVSEDAIAILQDQMSETQQPVVQKPAAPEVADETPREARASEAELSREERAELQVALQWAGFYDGRIDAAFGAGTRRSMSNWQDANDFEVTGILTTRQRAELLRQYNAVLEGMGMQRVTDTEAGIEMQLPLGAVEFARYEPPFVQFNPSGDLPARVLMISQEGTQDTLYGLYDIMQTLEIVPESGPRERRGDSFTLVGENARMISHTEARLDDGRIKGFTLIWPAGDEDRRARVLGLMQDSFTRLDGVLDPAAGSNDAQSIDLISGLEIRKPLFSRSGFFVDGRGTVVTTSEIVGACGHITIEDGQDAEITSSDADLGIAVLRPTDAIAPIGVAALAQDAPRLQSEVTVAGYSYGGVLGAPSLTFGTVSDVRGLDGNENVARLALGALEGDVGGPVMDAGGAVLGMLLPRQQGGRMLPEDVAFAADAAALMDVLKAAGTSPAAATPGAPLAPAQMADRAAGMTVLVSCWE
ncbi:Putative peptidoglycan binding domain-containing protein [Roseovarius nanhaiticus]|uniref:Putative peptidoglycan binding domain-containing protein n=1 Tax=Roseovarius nanhaiticus TaxID=573024 RepID=A0A1N7ET13_9RHOB|nr:trypsin-like peptidase domain-containing protein [Roseovarius nanhaiticus]SEK67155.1 Putative peptidoglycan binding domain-containing protein [Roseovarius nanhaiticus]SIR91268.1 Putative peptidoglycan binding domain-containing protein [Roseovarius nanhaiticus]